MAIICIVLYRSRSRHFALSFGSTWYVKSSLFTSRFVSFGLSLYEGKPPASPLPILGYLLTEYGGPEQTKLIDVAIVTAH